MNKFNCVKGIPCKNICIPRSNECLSELNDNTKTAVNQFVALINNNLRSDNKARVSLGTAGDPHQYFLDQFKKSETFHEALKNLGLVRNGKFIAKLANLDDSQLKEELFPLMQLFVETKANSDIDELDNPTYEDRREAYNRHSITAIHSYATLKHGLTDFELKEIFTLDELKSMYLAVNPDSNEEMDTSVELMSRLGYVYYRTTNTFKKGSEDDNVREYLRGRGSTDYMVNLLTDRLVGSLEGVVNTKETNAKGNISWKIRTHLRSLPYEDLSTIAKFFYHPSVGVVTTKDWIHLTSFFQADLKSLVGEHDIDGPQDLSKDSQRDRIGLTLTALLNAVANKFTEPQRDEADEYLTKILTKSEFSKSLAISESGTKIYYGKFHRDYKVRRSSDKKEYPFGSKTNYRRMMVGTALERALNRYGIPVGNFLRVEGKDSSGKNTMNAPYQGTDVGIENYLTKSVLEYYKHEANAAVNTTNPVVKAVLDELGGNGKSMDFSIINGRDDVEKLFTHFTDGNTNIGDLFDNHPNDPTKKRVSVDAEAYLSKMRSLSGPELERFFKSDMLLYLTNFGMKDWAAAEFVAAAYHSYVNDEPSVVLNNYDGKPFPFVDSAIFDSKTNKLTLISVKYGDGVPADIPALINLTDPNSKKIVKPQDMRDDGRLYRKPDNILEASDNGNSQLKIKLKPGSDAKQYLKQVLGHFDYAALGQSEAGKKINQLISELEAGKEVDLAQSPYNLNLPAGDFLGIRNSGEFSQLSNAANYYRGHHGMNNVNNENVIAYEVTRRYAESLGKQVQPGQHDTLLAEFNNKLQQLIGNPTELAKFLTSLGINGVINTAQTPLALENLKISRFYAMNVGLGHILSALFAQESVNKFIKDHPNIEAVENHPDLGPTNGLDQQCSNGIKLNFSWRPSAGTDSRKSSAGVQYKLGGCA